jgi:membrane protein implicated in regulation of membrane protease activity
MGTPRMMIVLLGAAALVVGATAALALGSWWILVAVLALHALASTLVIGYTLKRAGQTYDKPDPLTEARIEERERRRPARPRRTARDREVFN